MNAMVEQPRKGRRRRPSLARAEYLLASGNAREAIACAKCVLRRDREQIGALEVLAKALWQLSRFDELNTVLATLIRLNPYEPGYHELRGAVYQALGRIGEAMKCFARAGEESDIAGASIVELRNWQGCLIADLLREDKVFQAQYAQDPEGACRSRGFEFLPEYKPGSSWFASQAAQAVVFTRPS